MMEIFAVRFSPVAQPSAPRLPPPRDVVTTVGGSREFRLTIPGEPGAWQRPGARVINGHARLYQKAKTRKYEDIVRNVAAVQWAGAALIAGVPITMLAIFYRSIPASWSKKRIAMAASGELLPISKPDLDNYAKAIKDGLSGVVYVDDALIIDSHQRKFYAIQPRVEVFLSWAAL